MQLHIGVCRHCKRVYAESWLWERNPLLHQGIKPASVACQSDALPTEPHPHWWAVDGIVLQTLLLLCLSLQVLSWGDLVPLTGHQNPITCSVSVYQSVSVSLKTVCLSLPVCLSLSLFVLCVKVSFSLWDLLPLSPTLFLRLSWIKTRDGL